MKEIIFYLKNDRILKFAFFGSSMLLLFQILVLVLAYRNLPPLIPLYLQRPWGLLQIAEKAQILLLPSLTLFLIILNTFLAVFFYKESPLVSRILLWGQTLFSLLVTLTVIRTVFLIL